MWITLWETSGETGDNQWTAVGQRESMHRGPSPIPVEHTGAVHKKSALNWANDVAHSLHRPYDYDVLIYQVKTKSK